MTNIKAIETHWKGYRFRSRLEARWAVFFENMGWDWSYEPQGFHTAKGKYLPDFFLSKIDSGMWVEIKPRGRHDKDAEEKIKEVAFATKQNSILLTGDPMDFISDPGTAIAFDKHGRQYVLKLGLRTCVRCDFVTSQRSCSNCQERQKQFFSGMPQNYHAIFHRHIFDSTFKAILFDGNSVSEVERNRERWKDLCSNADISIVEYWSFDNQGADWVCRAQHFDFDPGGVYSNFSKNIENAAKRARAARFEHGEVPA